MKLPKVIFTDIDGVWTDGGMYYDQTGNEWKKFNTSDSWGVAFSKAYGIPVIIVTGEDTAIVKRRAEKLKVDFFMGVKDKVVLVESYLKENNLSWEDAAFIGDDVNDYFVLSKVGYSGCPNNAPDYIKSRVNFTGKKNGGDGAFREFVEHILTSHYSIEEMIKRVSDK